MQFRYLPCLAAIALASGLSACSAPPPATAPQAAPVAAAPAQPAAPSVADLQGARASSGESEMMSRGYTVARQRGLTAYWVHGASNTCVRTVTSQGRYQTVGTVPASNCGR